LKLHGGEDLQISPKPEIIDSIKQAAFYQSIPKSHGCLPYD
jgi:hypothetical protein